MSRNFIVSGLVLRIKLTYEKVICSKVSFGFFQILTSPVIFTSILLREVDVTVVDD